MGYPPDALLAIPAAPIPTAPKPIGCERIPCECTTEPWCLSDLCTDCNGRGYHDEPMYPADWDVGLDTLRRELDPTYPGPVCWGWIDCASMYFVDPGELRFDFCSGGDPVLENGGRLPS